MNCQFNDLVGRYYDGELPPAGHAQFEAHLATCAACAGELDQFASISRALRSAPAPGAPPDFARRMQALAGHMEEYKIVAFARRMSGVAAAVLIGAIGYVLLAHRTAPAQQQVLVPPWEQPSAMIETNLDSPAAASDDSATASNEPQFANLLVEDLSGGRP
jgi:anti-sigma factor RsiW